MLFIDLTAITDNEERAQNYNFRDLNNLVRTDIAISRANEFNAGQPGRLAAINLESDRRIGQTELLRPLLPTLNQYDVNSILGNAATRSVAGLRQQSAAQFILPEIPTLGANDAATTVARSNNDRGERKQQHLAAAASDVQNCGERARATARTSRRRERVGTFKTAIPNRQGAGRRTQPTFRGADNC